MTTPAQSNFSAPPSKQADAGFEASGLAPEEAERLASAFKPSWEFDEAPFTQGNGGLDARQIEVLGGGEHGGRENGDARTVPPHAPPQRVETNEPEVSVIIDRSITAAEMEAQRSQARPPASVRPPAPVAAASPFASPAFAAPAFAPTPPQRVAPVMRGPRTADESLELPASLKKSNKGLFIGLGVAVAAAALVLIVHGAMSAPEASPSASPTTRTPAAAATPAGTVTAVETSHVASPIPPPPPAIPTATAAPAPTQAAPAPTPIVTAPPPPTTPAPRAAAVAPRPPPHPAPPPVHHAAPKPAPKATAGGIVRDNPF